MGNINKKIRLKGETMARAWKELAHEDMFGGSTLGEFNDLLGRVQAANQRLVKLAGLTIEARLNRDNLHAELNRISQNVVNGVRAMAWVRYSWLALRGNDYPNGVTAFSPGLPSPRGYPG